MKTLTYLLLLLWSVTSSYSQSTINIPADYPTIQEGINAASNSDIVLVAEGTYYENINFRGKAITVASHFFVDNDHSHIQNTIINGSNPAYEDTGSVVIFNNGEDSASVLCGFTITGGTGTRSGAYRDGGAIYIHHSSATLQNNIIENNEVINGDWSQGGAIVANLPIYSHLIIEDNIIRNNMIETTLSGARCFGTVYISALSAAMVTVRNNEIYNNQVSGLYHSLGGGLMCYANNNVLVTCYIENNKIVNNQVMDTPGSSVQWGGGIYLESVNAIVRNNIIANNSAEDGGGIYYYNNLTPPLVTPLIENNTIYGNNATLYAGAINTDREINIHNCIIWGNSSPQFYGETATITYSNVEESYFGEGNIRMEPEFIDTMYFFLSDTSPCIDAGDPDPMYNDIQDPNNPGFALWPAFGTLRNDMGHFGGPNSLWYKWEWPLYYLPTRPNLIAPSDTVITSEFTFIWSKCSSMVTAYWFEIDTTDDFTSSFVDSLITDTTYFYSALNNGSYYWRVKAYNDFGWGIFSEIGTFPVIISGVEDENRLPVEFKLSQNYPNPFNPSTRIKYSIPQSSDVLIKVFDVLGNELETLVSEEKPAGNYEMTWYADNLPSGVYFYRLKAGSFVETKKMILLK